MIGMLFNKNKNVFDKINDYLTKKGHELVMSVYLSNYNGNNIYVRFDYVRKMSVYKIVWIDLNYLDEKNLEDYISSQLVTKYSSIGLVDKLLEINEDSSYSFNDKIIGDRVEILTYLKGQYKEYIFDRFIPLEWEFFIGPLAMIFSYLPRSMEIFFNEMVAKFDGLEERYNCVKPIKFDLFNDDLKEIIEKKFIDSGKKIFDNNKVKFLEKLDDKYIAVIEDKTHHLVTINCVEKEYATLLCNCKDNCYCKHIVATILALRENKLNNFYKVKYIGRGETLLEKITIGSFYVCFGYQDDKLLLVTSDGNIFPVDIVQNGKVVFEVIEDDDECSLSKELKKYNKK